MDGLVRSDFAYHLPYRIEKLRVHRGGVVGTPVAQEVIELLQAFFVVAPIALEGDRDAVVAMGVLQGKGAGLIGGAQRLRSQNDEGSDKCQLARRASGDADWVLAGFTDWHEKFRD